MVVFTYYMSHWFFRRTNPTLCREMYSLIDSMLQNYGNFDRPNFEGIGGIAGRMGVGGIGNLAKTSIVTTSVSSLKLEVALCPFSRDKTRLFRIRPGGDVGIWDSDC